jgi:hypothetical protein
MSVKQNEINIKAGADINAGDGGYALSTQAEYEKFVKMRNSNTRILELAEQASKDSVDGYPVTLEYTKRFAEKFAELIVKECVGIADEYDGVGSTIVNRIKEHFGVEE